MEHPFKYDYGETVRIATSAPSPLTPGDVAEVVGMIEMLQPRDILGTLCPKGTIAYQIEFPDGSCVEVTEICIEPHK